MGNGVEIKLHSEDEEWCIWIACCVVWRCGVVWLTVAVGVSYWPLYMVLSEWRPAGSDKDVLFECTDGGCLLVVFEIGGMDVRQWIERLDLTWDGEESMETKGARLSYGGG